MEQMNISVHSDCPLNIDPSSYSCANPYPNCTNSASFQFASLWLITQAIASCPTDPRLFHGQPKLTDASCRAFTNKKSWTPYPAADIWARLTTWKFPLLQLVAVFPRPPLAFWTEFFVLVHLLGDPISTINNLLWKMATCQRRAQYWKDNLDRQEMTYLNSRPREIIWKSLAAIVDSYDEWGWEVGNSWEQFLHQRLKADEAVVETQEQFFELCLSTAKTLAADRSTKFLPIIVAQGFFIGTIAIAFGRTRDSASGPNPATFINIEAHSIAFSSLYFWIIPAVILSSIIGVSQTEDAIPRTLNQFKDKISIDFPQWRALLPSQDLTAEVRERSGGIYSWQPQESRIDADKITPARNNTSKRGFFGLCWKVVVWVTTLRPGSHSFPLFIFTYSALTGMLISLLVPPVGIDCRHIGEILISSVWVVSFYLNNLPRYIPSMRLENNTGHDPVRAKRRRLFIVWKDSLVTAATMGGIIVTQVGVFNQCACYTLWGRTGLALPENDNVNKTLRWRIDTSYPAIAFICVSFQLIILPGLVLRQYGLAVRVFLQRDDEKSNWPDFVIKFKRWLAEVWGEIAERTKKLWRSEVVYDNGHDRLLE